MACPGRWLPLGPGVRGIPGPAHAGLDACAGMRCMHRRVVESRRAQGERLCGTPPEPAVSSCLAAARATRLVAATRHGRVPCAPRQGAGHVCRTRLRAVPSLWRRHAVAAPSTPFVQYIRKQYPPC